MASVPSESDGVGIVAHQRAAERDGVRCEKLALRPMRGLQGGDVEGVERFALHLVMIHHGAVAGHDFGDCVGEVDVPAPG